MGSLIGKGLNLTSMTERDLSQVLSWRTNEDVSNGLFTEVENDLEKQRQWFYTIKDHPTVHYWIIRFDDVPIGVIHIHDYSEKDRRCSYGVYIGNKDYRGKGLSRSILAGFYNYCFKVMGLNKIFIEAFEDNRIIKTHLSQGYRIIGVAKKHIFKKGEYRNVTFLELTAADWAKQDRWQGVVLKIEPWER